MKKIICFVLAVVIVLALFVGCAAKEAEDNYAAQEYIPDLKEINGLVRLTPLMKNAYNIGVKLNPEQPEAVFICEGQGVYSAVLYDGAKDLLYVYETDDINDFPELY